MNAPSAPETLALKTGSMPAETTTGISQRAFFAAMFCLLIAGAFLAPDAPFIIDGGIYADMAKAFAEEGALYIGGNGGVDGAPALTRFLTYAHNGLVYPQYPSGYAVLAAPFYKAFGMRGLMLMNALAFGACIILTLRIAERFYDSRIARWAAAIFALASFAPTYAFPIWPHMLSLLFWLGGVFLAVKAADAQDRKSAWLYLLGAGAIIGAGVNIRIDVILAAIAVFIWLRAFARPEDRLAPLALALGMAPGLLLAAMLNEIKFGAFTPFTYNTSGDAADVRQYAPIIIAAAAVMAALWMFNAKKIFLQTRSAYGAWPILALLAVTLSAALLLAPLRDILWRMAKGVYVLVINLQAQDAYVQTGVERNEYGQLLFWGYPKKAFIQSLPYLPLIAVPVFHFLRGKNLSAVALCLLVIAAPISFYGLNEWHGGGSYNMRYFFPALPFVAILSAAALAELVDASGRTPRRQSLLIIAAIAGLAYLGLQELANASERFLAPASLYPQWLIAAALFTALGFYLRALNPQKTARIALTVSLSALAYASAINLYEELSHEKTRTEQLAMSRDASAPIPPGALVLSQLPLTLIPAETAGAFVMVGEDKNIVEAARAAAAFLKADRCVYFHNPSQRDLIEPYLQDAVSPDVLWAPSNRFGHDPRLAFYTFKSQREQCAF